MQLRRELAARTRRPSRQFTLGGPAGQPTDAPLSFAALSAHTEKIANVAPAAETVGGKRITDRVLTRRAQQAGQRRRAPFNVNSAEDAAEPPEPGAPRGFAGIAGL